MTALAFDGTLTSGDRHDDPDIGGSWLDAVDPAYWYAQNAHLITGIKPYRGGEVADDLVAGPRRPHQVNTCQQKQGQSGGQYQPQPPPAFSSDREERHGDFGLMIHRSWISPRR